VDHYNFELNFHDDIITPARGEHKLAYTIIEEKKHALLRKLTQPKWIML